MLLTIKADKSSRLHASFDYNLRRNKYMGNKTQDKENMQGCPCLQNKNNVKNNNVAKDVKLCVQICNPTH